MTVQCSYCERCCTLSAEHHGYCGMYTVAGGRVVERYPHRYSSMQVAHIETVPFFHYQPGSRTLILGGAGCNFDCRYCSNAHVARSEPEPLLLYDLPPDRVHKFVRDYGCHNIAYAVNEPTVALPTLLELAQAAHAAGVSVGALTNGYTTPEATEAMGQAFDFVNVSIKGASDAFYRDYAGVPHAQVVMRNIEILYRLTHLEVSTPIVQEVNDGDIPAIAGFLAGIDRHIPWHVFRLLPEYKMANEERPSIDAINAALEAARQQLDFVYFGNFVGSRWVSTRCPACHAVAIERINLSGCSSKAIAYALEENRCAACGANLMIHGEPVSWHSKDGVQS